MKREEKTERKCSHNTVKSTSRTMSMRESSSANKAYGCLQKQPYPLVLCCAKPRLHPLNSFNVVHTLWPPSHTFHTSLHMHERPSQKHSQDY